MTATKVPVEIVCPHWCIVSPQEHAAELWEHGGDCVHLGAEVPVYDVTGWNAPLEEPRFNPPVHVAVATVARPDGRETRPPVFTVDGHDLTIQQAVELAAEITRQVEMYREAGGVA